MLEKLATHEVESITTLFYLADKCARATEGRAWHSAPQDGDTKAGGSGATAQGGGKKKKNKNRSRGEPQLGGPAVAAAAPAAVMAVTYTCRNSDGLVVPSYFSGRCGRNLDSHATARR